LVHTPHGYAFLKLSAPSAMAGIEDRRDRPVKPMPTEKMTTKALSSVLRPSGVDSRA